MTEAYHPPASPPASELPRAIRSFVRRQGRMTPAQERALRELWPQFGLEFSVAPLDFAQIFGREAPRVLEIGFGNGEALLAMAGARPQEDFLGIEVHEPGVGHLLLGARAAQLHNLRVLRHDAVEVLKQQIPASSLQEILIFFPDPWPKKRHHKRRLIQPTFLQLLAGKLKPGGVLRLATDWEHYALQMLDALNACAQLRNCSSAGGFAERPELRPLTRFERRGQRLGHGVWDLAFTTA